MSSVLQAGKTAVITGASSGIGRAAALDFASKGMNVWMIDNDAEELEEAKALVQKFCATKLATANNDTVLPEIRKRVVDVSNATAMMELADEVFADGGKCHFLFNNAGVQLSVPKGGLLADTNNETMKFTLDVNLYGPVHGCLAFVPNMKASGEECIVVNTGSKQGITMPPGNLPYNVSKAALKCYTEGLEHDLRNSENCRVRAALLVPGWVNTSIMLKNSRKEALARGETFSPDSVFFHETKPAKGAWMPQQVIDFMVDELDKGRFYLICPDNDVDRETDNLRMTWAMQDITQDRPPLSRWHGDYKDKFTDYLSDNKTKK
jgi:NAD(P)-dependent dehydrogenase (short-subunit alcohol dehydrogenase family)